MRNFAVLATAAAVATTGVLAQDNFTPLASQHFTYTALPYKADPNNGERGTQYGYNICNSTTENQESLCQTAIINSLDDFCLWGPPEPNSLVGNTEGEAVAWCSKPGHGTRLIPQGALTGVQFIRTPDYIQITGNIQQALINMAADDSGGEMDPHGADQRGNPLGGLVFTNAWSKGNNNSYIQAIEWHNFMGGAQFCLKACDPSGPNAAHYCEHIYDRIGCLYNAPASYADNEFTSCDGDSQDFPGIYTGSDGVVSTYTQPPESLGPISTMPYQPKVPATSNCQTFQSAAIYTGLPSGSVAATSSAAATSGASAATGSVTRAASSTRANSSAGASATTSANGAGSFKSEGMSSAFIALFAAAAGFVALL